MKIMKTTMKNYIILWILSLTIPAYAQVITNGKRIHELPAKDTIKSDYLIIQGSSTTGKLYKTKMSVLNSAYSGGGGGSTDTTSLSNRIDKKLNKTDTSTLSNRINAKESAITATTSSDYYRGDKTFQTLNKSAVGLSNVDNTSDATKNSATSTLTNKTISGSANTFSNISESSVTNLVSDLAAKESTITSGSTSQYWRGDKTWQTLTIPTQFNPIAGSNITLTGTYPNITIASSGGGGGGDLDNTLNIGNVTNKQYIFSHNSNDQETVIKIDSTIYRANSGQLVWKAVNPDHGISNAVGDLSMSTYWGSKSSVNGLSNFVSMWGYNNSYGGGLVNSNDGSIHISLEGRWDQGGGTNYKELHLPQVNYQKANGSGIEKTLRASTWLFDVNPTNRSADLSFNLTGYHVGILPLAFDSSSVSISNLDITRDHLAFQSSDNNAYISLLKTGNSTPFVMQLSGSSNNDITMTSQGSITFQPNNGGVINLSGFIDNPSGSYRITAPSGTTNWGLEINSNSNYGQLYVRNGSSVSMFVTTTSNTIFGNGNNYDGNYKISVDGGAKIYGGMDIESTTKGFLPPRMTTTQKNAISSPAEGLTVYDNTLHKLYVYDGSTWQAAW
jgi:hypothetical protein